jgi:macrolide-specific efflux system membrane fusion protein
VRIANLGVMTLNAEVAEADVGKLKPGMPVYFTTLGQNDRRWKSTIRQVLPTPTVTNNVVLYTVLVDIDNPDGQLMTQMTAQVFFVQGEASALPLVPLSALQPQGKDKYQVQVDKGGSLETRTVTVALANRSQAAISSGLKAGEKVILSQSAEPTKKQRANAGGPPARI